MENEIFELVGTIFSLMRQVQNAWVKWDSVSRCQTGTTLWASHLQSLAALPQWEHFFVTKGNVVKLSEEGLRIAPTLPPPPSTEMAVVANAVIHYARMLQPIQMPIEDVSTVAKAGHKFVQAVHVALGEDLLPSETPVTIRPKFHSSVNGTIVGQEPDGGVLYVAFESEILKASLPADLCIDRAFLLSQLAAQLRTVSTFPPRLHSLLNEATGQCIIADDDSKMVANGLANLATPWSRFLWGPPGAGKTYGIGHFAAQVLKADPDSSMLIVAPSNRAVDVAVKHLRNRLECESMSHLIRDRKILRFGYPRMTEIIEVPELLGPVDLDELNRHVREISLTIVEADQKQLNDTDLAVLRAKLLAKQEEVKQAVHNHVQQCSIVATTTTLAYMPTSPISSKRWDTVIVDEVTMVPPAICAFLAAMTNKRLLLAGDPRQLGPVYEEAGQTQEVYDWMGRDMFDKCGVSTGTNTNRTIQTNDARLTRITAQRRCPLSIWSKVKHLYPEVHHASPDRTILARLPPAPNDSVVLLDTSGTSAKCENTKGSWRNRFTAGLTMEVATTIASEATGTCSIAIICPYRAQASLLRQWIREERKADATPFKKNITVEAGTVHQFQGSDADVVIFDLVDGRGRDGLGLLLRDDTGLRLVNVAMTRARGKLIVIADKAWYSDIYLGGRNSILTDVILGKAAAIQVRDVTVHALGSSDGAGWSAK